MRVEYCSAVAAQLWKAVGAFMLFKPVTVFLVYNVYQLNVNVPFIYHMGFIEPATSPSLYLTKNEVNI